eukprot:GHVQ01023645.1.p1 GENE.GHVQ01023645.1~~GHVQ01023645.1.p1  ORF type:complete len:714 (+),score=135.10 GHVQ01023645.1:3054-5195(+)
MLAKLLQRRRTSSSSTLSLDTAINRTPGTQTAAVDNNDSAQVTQNTEDDGRGMGGETLNCSPPHNEHLQRNSTRKKKHSSKTPVPQPENNPSHTEQPIDPQHHSTTFSGEPVNRDSVQSHRQAPTAYGKQLTSADGGGHSDIEKLRRNSRKQKEVKREGGGNCSEYEKEEEGEQRMTPHESSNHTTEYCPHIPSPHTSHENSAVGPSQHPTSPPSSSLQDHTAAKPSSSAASSARSSASQVRSFSPPRQRTTTHNTTTLASPVQDSQRREASSSSSSSASSSPSRFSKFKRRPTHNTTSHPPPDLPYPPPQPQHRPYIPTFTPPSSDNFIASPPSRHTNRARLRRPTNHTTLASLTPPPSSPQRGRKVSSPSGSQPQSASHSPQRDTLKLSSPPRRYTYRRNTGSPVPAAPSAHRAVPNEGGFAVVVGKEDEEREFLPKVINLGEIYSVDNRKYRFHFSESLANELGTITGAIPVGFLSCLTVQAETDTCTSHNSKNNSDSLSDDGTEHDNSRSDSSAKTHHRRSHRQSAKTRARRTTASPPTSPHSQSSHSSNAEDGKTRGRRNKRRKASQLPRSSCQDYPSPNSRGASPAPFSQSPEPRPGRSIFRRRERKRGGGDEGEARGRHGVRRYRRHQLFFSTCAGEDGPLFRLAINSQDKCLHDWTPNVDAMWAKALRLLERVSGGIQMLNDITGGTQRQMCMGRGSTRSFFTCQ